MNCYYYAWGNNEKRKTMKGRECRVLARGKKNSILIEFTDNLQREVVSGNSIRRRKAKMKALTIWPEWAWAICRLGKDIENRKMKPPSTLKVGDPLAIHASANLGGSSKYIKNDEVFEPVNEMARRSGWRIGHEPAENRLVVYNVSKPDNFRVGVHNIPTASVVAVAIFDGFLSMDDIPLDNEEWPWWSPEVFGWKLRDVKVLKTPIWCRGQQGIWNLPDNIKTAVLEQVDAN